MTPILLALAVAVTAIPDTPQRTPDDLVDLVGASSSFGELELLTRGFHFVGYSGDEAERYTYWLHSASRRCVVVAIIDSQFALITPLPPADCAGKEGVRYVPRIWPR